MMVINFFYIKDELLVGYVEFGYFMVGFLFGYVVGFILVGKVIYKSRCIFMFGGLFIGGFIYILLGFNYSIVMVVIIEIVVGVCIVFFNVYNIMIC